MTAGLTEEKNEVPNIQIGEVIAHGATSTVRKGKSQSGAEYAIKIIFTETQNRKQEAKKEASIHKALAHKHIVKIQNFHQSKTHAYIIMDYAAKNELFMYIDPGTGLSEDICHLYLKQLFSVIKYIHSRGICHRDIKPENILLDSNYNLLLTDFGCSTIYRDANGRRPLTKHCGSSNYMAPDIHYGEYDGELVDVWSFGIVALVLLTGVVPWEKPVVEDKNFERFRISTFRDYSPFNLLGKNKLEMIEKCISVSQDKRIRLSRLGENPWLSAPNLYMDPDGMIRSPEIVAAKLVPADIAAFTQPDVCISPMGKECSSQPVFLSYDTFPIATRIYSCALVSVSLRILCKAI